MQILAITLQFLERRVHFQKSVINWLFMLIKNHFDNAKAFINRIEQIAVACFALAQRCFGLWRIDWFGDIAFPNRLTRRTALRTFNLIARCRNVLHYRIHWEVVCAFHVDRLRARFNSGSRHRSAKCCAQVCWVRTYFSGESRQWSLRET